MKNHWIALVLILVAGLTSRAHATKGEGKLVETAVNNLTHELTKAEESGYVLDQGTSVHGVYVTPGKTAVLRRVWRNPAVKFRIAVGKTAGDGEVNAEATINNALTGLTATMDADSGDLQKGYLSEETETGKAPWKFTFKNTGKKPIYFLIAYLRESSPVLYESAAIETAVTPLLAELESSPRSLSQNTHSLAIAIVPSKTSWDWNYNFKKGIKFAMVNDKGSDEVTISVLAKDKSVIVAPQPGDTEGFSLEEDVPGAWVKVLNSGEESVLMAFLYR